MEAVTQKLLTRWSREDMKRAGLGKWYWKGRDRIRAASDRNEKNNGVMGEREEQHVGGR